MSDVYAVSEKLNMTRSRKQASDDVSGFNSEEDNRSGRRSSTAAPLKPNFFVPAHPLLMLGIK